MACKLQKCLLDGSLMNKVLSWMSEILHDIETFLRQHVWQMSSKFLSLLPVLGCLYYTLQGLAIGGSADAKPKINDHLSFADIETVVVVTATL